MKWGCSQQVVDSHTVKGEQSGSENRMNYMERTTHTICAHFTLQWRTVINLDCVIKHIQIYPCPGITCTEIYTASTMRNGMIQWSSINPRISLDHIARAINTRYVLINCFTLQRLQCLQLVHKMCCTVSNPNFPIAPLSKN